ncbi:MAG: FAD-dependent oxidoreductase, partial [Acidobacteriia bacterium]|nr:FAD-dependent oxidoreductase [Terriglobia bacterium]
LEMALFYRGDHQLDNRALLDALIAAAKKSGVEIRSGTKVDRLHKEGDRITGVETGGETLAAKTVVLSAGAWTPQIVTGENVPVYPTRGQIIAVHSDRPLLRHTLRYEGGYVAVFPDNRLLLGGTMEDAGFNKVNTAEAMGRIFSRAEAAVPSIGRCEFVEAWSGLRPNSSDHSPILGPASREGLIYATGHFRNGMLLTPITADLISTVVETGRVPPEIEPFGIQRFLS